MARPTVTRYNPSVKDELTKQAQEGNLVINGSSDILTMVLGTREHSGRVRGMGKFITPTTYFNVPRCGSKKYISDLEEKQMLNEARMDDALKVIANLAKEIEIIKSGSHSTTNSEKIESNETRKILKKRSEKKWSTDKFANRSLSNMKIKNVDINVENQHEYRPIKQSRNCVASSNIRKSEPCRLALGSKNIIVARGLVFDSKPNEKIHNILLGEQNVRVVVEEIFCPHQMLPITNDELTFIEDALGTHVAWPRAFVLTSTKANDNVSKSVDRQIDSSMNQKQENESTEVGVIESFAKYVANIAQDDNQYCVPIIDEVFGTQVDVFLAPSDMIQLCNMRDLQPGLIKIYISKLHEDLKSNNIQEKYGFIVPGDIRSATGITKRLSSFVENQLCFFPCKIGTHWTLLIINLSSSSSDVYWFAPSGQLPDSKIKIIINTVGPGPPWSYTESATDVKGQDFNILPFGTRRRSCVGMPLGHRMVHYSSASLLHYFEWDFPVDILEDLTEKVGITLQKAKTLVGIPKPRLSS